MMRDFFQLILPSHGWYYITTPALSSGGFKHFPCSSIVEMEAKAHELDSNQQQVYFACASYKEASYTDKDDRQRWRTNENAGWAKSFWLDIDCGATKAADGKGYESRSEAGKVLIEFIRAVGLPKPILVSSGGGLHVYWILDAAITKEEWKPVAEKLKQLTHCPEIRLLADDTRTADITSVLRPVGTHNWKPEHGGKAIELKWNGVPASFAQFASLIEAAHQKYVCVAAPKAVITTTINHDPETSENIARVKSALSFIDPNCSYELWRDICFALHAFGWSCSEQLARSWSMGELR